MGSRYIVNVPKADLPVFRALSKRMGWKVVSQRKNGIERGLEDIEAGRVYSAESAEDMIAQILG